MHTGKTARSSPHSRRKTRWLIGGGALGIVLLAFLFFDPAAFITDLVTTARIRWELPAARERWMAQDIKSYRVDIKGAVPLSCLLDGELTVREGDLAAVRMRSNVFVPESPLEIVDPEDWLPWGCPFQDLTVEKMFERVETLLQNTGPLGGPLRVSFDGQLGYIREYHYGRASYRGLLGAAISDCCSWFEFDNLEIISP